MGDIYIYSSAKRVLSCICRSTDLADFLMWSLGKLQEKLQSQDFKVNSIEDITLSHLLDQSDAMDALSLLQHGGGLVKITVKMIQQAADKMMKEKGILDLVQRQGAAAVLSSEVKNRYALLPWMAANGHEAIVGLLVEEGADLKAKDAYGYTPLHLASWRGNEATVRWLLKRGANFEAQDATNYTPLYMAVRNGHKAIARSLLEKGAGFRG
ncbi:ankyrin repeat-containing domain protein [Ustulina deusta]|nr:ankyrin repeat-containing domain protein [Ustulina deusta]